MKRLLDIVAVVLMLLAVGVGWKIVQVAGVEPPVFGDVPQLAANEQLPPAPQSPTPQGAALDTITAGNLFETDRGATESAPGDAVVEDQPPLPPPTNVVLNGVFFQMGGRPMAIMTDTNSGNRQLTLQKGDNLGDYQVGDISRQRVVLLGRSGQEFSLELDIKKGGGPAPVAGRPTPGQAARPAQPARAGTPATPARSPAAERVSQTAAQRAAEARRLQAARARQNANARRDQASAEPERPDATQARLEALRRLREAARTR